MKFGTVSTEYRYNYASHLLVVALSKKKPLPQHVIIILDNCDIWNAQHTAFDGLCSLMWMAPGSIYWAEINVLTFEGDS